MSDMPRITISISDELNIWLEEQAKLNNRSKSGQAAWLLGQFYKELKPFSDLVNPYLLELVRARGK